MFDPNTFLQTTVNEASSTEFVTVPEGTYNGHIEKLDGIEREIQGEKRAIIEVTWAVNDSTVAEATGRDKNTVRQSIFLDMTPEGHLDMSRGKNVQLGRTREALKQNNPGKPWKFADMLGQPARITVQHTKNGDKTFANVTAVMPL